MADLPINVDSMVQGLGYFQGPALTTDACSTAGADADRIPNLPNGEPSPLQAMSIATKKEDAPDNPQTWNSGDKGTNWMGTAAYTK